MIANFLLIFTLKSFATAFYFTDNDASKVASLPKARTGTEKVYFINEHLYGVEFYMGSSFARFSNEWKARRAFEAGKNIRWVVFQNKRSKLIEKLKASFNKEFINQKTSGNGILRSLKKRIIPKRLPL